jgi:hypothetical protein
MPVKAPTLQDKIEERNTTTKSLGILIMNCNRLGTSVRLIKILCVKLVGCEICKVMCGSNKTGQGLERKKAYRKKLIHSRSLEVMAKKNPIDL